MPDSVKVHPYIEYKFSEDYTAEYVLESIEAITMELSRRTDIEATWMEDILEMCNATVSDRDYYDRSNPNYTIFPRKYAVAVVKMLLKNMAPGESNGHN